MAAVHLSEADLARDLHAILEQVRQGREVVIKQDQQPAAIMKPADREPRTLTELIVLAEQREKERGYAVKLDGDYAADVERIVHDGSHGRLVRGTDLRHQHPRVVTLMELAHGIERAQLDAHRARSQAFLEDGPQRYTMDSN